MSKLDLGPVGMTAEITNLRAGADHVVLSVLDDDGHRPAIDSARELARSALAAPH